MFTKLRQDLSTEFQRSGFLGACRWLVAYSLTIPYEHIVFNVFIRSLEIPLPVIMPRLPITMRLATEADLPRLQKLVLPSEYQHFRNRLNHGRFCFLAFPKENPTELVSYCWATTKIEPDTDDLRFDLPPNTGYIDDAFTVPAYRRQKIQSALHIFRLQHLKSLGCKQAVVIIDVKNIASQAVIRKLEYNLVGQATYQRVLKKVISPLKIILPD